MKNYALSQLVASVAIYAILISATHAEEASNTSALKELTLEFNLEERIDENTDQRFNERSLSLGAVTSFLLNPSLSLNADVEFEGVSIKEEDGSISEADLVVDELYFSFKKDNITLVAGKFQPSFGLAHDKAVGLFSGKFVDDYKLEKRLGVGTVFSFGDETVGKHQFQINAFKADTSALSNSLLDRTTRLRRDQGGASNTAGLESYSVSLTGHEMTSLPGLTYHFGYLKQAHGVDSKLTETGLVVGIEQEFINLGVEGLTTKLMGEIAAVKNAETEDVDKRYSAVGISFDYDNWTTGISAASVKIKDHVELSTRVDWNAQAFISYQFEQGSELEVGYSEVNEEDTRSRLFGFKLSIPLIEDDEN